MAKHFDNKRDLLEEMKKTKRMNDHLSAVVFKGYMLEKEFGINEY